MKVLRLKKLLGACPDCGSLRRKRTLISGTHRTGHCLGIAYEFGNYQQICAKCGYNFGTVPRGSTSADYLIQ